MLLRLHLGYDVTDGSGVKYMACHGGHHMIELDISIISVCVSINKSKKKQQQQSQSAMLTKSVLIWRYPLGITPAPSHGGESEQNQSALIQN